MSRQNIQAATETCPCCGFTTLTESSADEICVLCGWQDDGQNDSHADEIWGGPNKHLSLTRARGNFRDHFSKYEVGNDPSIGGADTSAERTAKQAIVIALRALSQAESLGARTVLWAQVAAAESVLDSELRGKLAAYEANFRSRDAI